MTCTVKQVGACSFKFNGENEYDHAESVCVEECTKYEPSLMDAKLGNVWWNEFWTDERLDMVMKDLNFAAEKSEELLTDPDERNLLANDYFRKAIIAHLAPDFLKEYRAQKTNSDENLNNQPTNNTETEMAKETFAAGTTAAQIETINANRKYFTDALNAVKGDDLEWSIEGNKIVLYARGAEITFTYNTTNRKRIQWTDAAVPNAKGTAVSVRVYWQTPARAGLALAGVGNINIWTKHITDECFASLCRQFPHLADALKAARGKDATPDVPQDSGATPAPEPTDEQDAEDAPTEETTEETPDEQEEQDATPETPQDEPTEDEPTDDAPTEDAPTEDASTEDAPTENVPTETVPTETEEEKRIPHAMFALILNFIKLKIACYLYGPAGTGKSEICRMVAKALGLEFYFSNAVTQEHKIDGFVDAYGVYHETQFFQAFTKGGLFFLDEMDASIPEVLVALNAALANGYYNFPTGRFYAHPDFRCIAAGNTIGTGSDVQYTGRSVIDAASLNRFAKIAVGYDHNIELKIADGNVSVVQFVEDVRNAVKECGLNHVVSYRNTDRLVKLEPVIGRRDAIKYAIVETLDKDDLQMLTQHLQADRNVYVKELKYLANA